MISINGRHDQGVGAEIGPDDLKDLDALADDVAAVELREGERPGELRQESEKRGQDVGDWQVKNEEVHSSYFCSEKRKCL